MKRVKVFSLLVLCAVALSSCGAATDAAPQEESGSGITGMSVAEIPMNEDETFSGIRCCGDSIIVETDAMEAEGAEAESEADADDEGTNDVGTNAAEATYVQRFYYAQAGADFPEEPFCSFDYNERSAIDFIGGEDGNVFFILTEAAEEEDSAKLLEISADGSERTVADLNDLCLGSSGESIWDWSIRAVPGGDFLLVSKYGYRLISQEGEIVRREDWKEPRSYDVLYAGGKYALTLQAENFQTVYGTFQRENGKLGTLRDISQDARFNRTGNGEDSLYMYTNMEASLCNLSTGEHTKMFDWTDIGIQGDSVLGMYGDTQAPRFLFREDNILYEAQWNGGNPGTERTELRLGYVSDSAATRRAVAMFNRTNPDFLIRMVDYGTEDESAAAMRLYTELTAGTGPDIFRMDGGYMDDRAMGERGLLEDLTPYLESSQVVSPQNLLPSVYEALQTEGKVYMLPTNFRLGGFITKERWAPAGQAWTAEELLRILEEEPELRDTMSSKSHMLEYCLSVMLGAGGEDGASVLEDGLLEKYIRLAGYMPEEAVYIPDDSLRQDGKLLFESFVLMDSETYMFHKAEWGEDVAFVGYPGGAGNGMMLYADNCYAVSAQSRHKDGAWKFVESFFTREWQEKITPNYAFSVDRDRFEQQLKHAEQVQWYTDRDGRQREAPVLTYDMNGEVVEVFAPRPEDTDSLRQMVEGARMIKRGDVEALRIVQEEAAYYFAGQKSLKEVADIIRNRMGLMAEERK